MKKSRHPVTDHAIIRYLERVQGFNIEGLRREIGRVADKGLTAGANGVISGGFIYVIDSGFVVTVVPQHEPRRGHPRRKLPHGA